MKTFLTTILIGLFAISSIAENTPSIKYINPTQIKDVYEINNTAAIFSHLEYREIDKTNVFQLSYLDDSKTKQFFDVSSEYNYYGMHSSGSVSFFVFKSNQKQALTIFAVRGKDVTPIVKEIDYSENEVYSGIRNITATAANKLFIVRGYSVYEKTNPNSRKLIEAGDHITCIDENLEVVGNQKYPIDLTERYKKAQSFYGTSNGLVIGYETYETSKKRYASEMVMFNNQAEKKGSYNLVDDKGVNFPSRIISHEGKTIISGFRMEGRVFTSKNSDGLFVAILNKNGELENTNLYSWDNLKQKLKESGRASFIFNTKMKVLVEDIVPTANGYRIICESYSSSGGNNGAKVALGVTDKNQHVITIQDFVILETDKAGLLTSSSIYKKEKVNVLLAGSSRGMRHVQLSNMLLRSKVFPYVSINGDKIKFVNYTNHVGELSELDLNTGKISPGKKIELEPVFPTEVHERNEAMVSNSKFLTKMSNLEQKSNNFGNKFEKAAGKVVYAIEDIDLTFNPYQRKEFGYFSFANVKTILYKINAERHEVFYEYI